MGLFYCRASSQLVSKAGGLFYTTNTESTSNWTVTGDSTLTSLTNKGTVVDTNGKTVTIKGSDGTIHVNGTSSYTVTVDEYQK